VSIHRHQCACSCAEELAEITEEVKAERDALVDNLETMVELLGREKAENAQLREALEGMVHGLPELLESIGYTDEEGMIDKAVAALKTESGDE
jgi:hypothetical protein